MYFPIHFEFIILFVLNLTYNDMKNFFDLFFFFFSIERNYIFTSGWWSLRWLCAHGSLILSNQFFFGCFEIHPKGKCTYIQQKYCWKNGFQLINFPSFRYKIIDKHLLYQHLHPKIYIILFFYFIYFPIEHTS